MNFKEKWENTDKGGRARLIFLSLIVIFMAYLTVYYTKTIYDLDPGNVDQDNAVIALAGTIAQGFMGFAALGIYAAIVLVSSVILSLLLRFIGIRKTSTVTDAECELSMNLIGLGGFAGLIIGIIVTGFSNKSLPVLFSLLWMAAAFTLYLIPLRKAKT